MRLILCSAVLATAIFGVYGLPTDLGGADAPRKGNPNSKPHPPGIEQSRPSQHFKPAPQISDSLPASQSSSSSVLEAVAQSTVSSELPSLEAVVQAGEISSSSGQPTAHDPILETTNSFPAAETVVQDAIPEMPAAAAGPEQNWLQSAADSISAAVAAVPPIEAQQASQVNLEIDSAKLSKSLPGKSRRHAGVEAASALRIGDFEDVEVDTGLLPFTLKAAPEYPSTHEQMVVNQEISKEEMILMAMDHAHHVRPQLNSNLARPAANRPTLGNSGPILSKPQFENFEDRENEEVEGEDLSENESTVDLRNGESPATIVQEPAVPAVAKINPGSKINTAEVSNPYGGGSRNKPRPYGMDRPSKNRPTLDSGMKDKNEQFGLHHMNNDYVHKGEGSGANTGGTTSYLGFQIPSLKWPTFTDLFPSFWGIGRASRTKEGLGKSDKGEASVACEEDEDVVGEGVRSPTIQSSGLCSNSGVVSSCHSACVNNGYASGSCLGPYPTPGCLCRMPKSKEFGVIYTALNSTSDAKTQDLQTSASTPCKKCECLDSCKSSGSYTGFCADKCYCGVPWVMKNVQ